MSRSIAPLGLAATILLVAATLPVAAKASYRASASRPPAALASGGSQAEHKGAPASNAQPAEPKCPDHSIRKWVTTYRGRRFQVTRLPRCTHIEPVIAYNPRGETKERAQERLSGVAVCSGSFHHPRTMAIADFLQTKGEVISDPTTNRWFLAVLENGELEICGDHKVLKDRPGISALALGQRLVPLRRDGFSRSFMNEVTQRMALGLTQDSIYIVQGKSDIRRLADFMQRKLHCVSAINADGGHVVYGKAPVHIVFRWREPAPAPSSPPAQEALHSFGKPHTS